MVAIYCILAVLCSNLVLQSCILRQGEPYLFPQTRKRAGLFHKPIALEDRQPLKHSQTQES